MNKVLKIIVCILVFILIVSYILYTKTTVLLNSESNKSEINFIKNSHLELPIKINKKDCYGLFDTGAQLTVVDEEFADKYGVLISPIKFIKVNNNKYYSCGIIRSLKIGEFEFKNVYVVVIDWKKNNTSLGCKQSNIIIGMNLIKTLVWDFDFKSEKLIVTRILENDTFGCRINYENSYTPEMYVNVCRDSIKVLLDLGSDSELSVINNLVCDSIGSEYCYTSDLTEDVYGKINLKGNLLIEDVNISNFHFKNALIYTSQNNNLIGTSFFFKYFTGLILNPIKKEIICKPKMKEKTFYNKKLQGFGFSFDRSHNAILVKSIYGNSLAAKLNFSINDTIISINEFNKSDLIELDYCNFISKRKSILSKDEIEISLLKNGKIFDYHLFKSEY